MGSQQVLWVLVALGLVAQGHAWWFFSSRRQEPAAPVSEECMQKADTGDCDFYACFEQRHPCSRHNYALHYGWHFCTQFDHHYTRLNEQGKAWVNATRLCAMDQLKQFYHDDFITCDDVHTEMVDTQAECAATHGLCSSTIIHDNVAVFQDVYAVNERSARRFAQAVKHCSLTKAREAITWLGERYRAVIPNIRRFFADLGDSFNDFRDSVMDLFDDIS